MVRAMKRRLRLALAALVSLGCGSHGGGDENVGPDTGESGAGSDSATQSEGGVPLDGGGATDGSRISDSNGPTVWDGGFSGPLTCASPGNYAANCACACGVERWSIKTGSDSASGGVSLLPTLTTIGQLVSIAPPSPFPSSGTPRVSGAETTAFALKDVRLVFARLEDDSDYHLVLSDGTNTMITEVPYPKCVSGGPWGCLISRARAAVEANIGVSNLMLDMGHDHNVIVSVVGVGFWDPEHGQFGVAPNNLELHAILAICFGQGCDPTK
jgi:hypothetical protein